MPFHHLSRAAGAALASLLGPGRAAWRRPAYSHLTLGEVLSDSEEFKPLGEIMADALGIDLTPPEPEAEPAPAPEPEQKHEPDYAAMFGLKGEG